MDAWLRDGAIKRLRPTALPLCSAHETTIWGSCQDSLMEIPNVQPNDIRYIKLGDGGRWAQQSLSEGVLCFGYHSIPHEICERKDWDGVRNLLSDRKSEGAQTAGVNEV